jgi:hypothetical protein
MIPVCFWIYVSVLDTTYNTSVFLDLDDTNVLLIKYDEPMLYRVLDSMSVPTP